MKYYIALYEKLKETYSRLNSQENDICLICPSLRVYEREELQLLKPSGQIPDKDKAQEAILKKQDASYQLNSVPISQKYWDVNPTNTLFSVYREILDTVGISGLKAELENIVAADMSKLYDEEGEDTEEFQLYNEYLELYSEILEEISEHHTLYEDLKTENEKEIWNEKLSLLTREKSKRLGEWERKGNKSLIEGVLDTINGQSQLDKYLAQVQNAKMDFDMAEHTDIISNNSIHTIEFIPYDFMDNENGWTSLKLDKKDLDSIYNSIDKKTEELPPEILSIDYDEEYIEGIELEYQFVTLKRGWFDKSIFTSEFYRNNGSKPISDGISISNAFKLPAFPKTMILARNLKINIDSTVSDTQVSNPNQIINFGPIILKSQLFVNKKSNQKFLKVVTNKQTLKSDQLSFLKMRIDPKAVKEVEVKQTAPIKKAATMNRPVMMARGNPIPILTTPQKKADPAKPLQAALMHTYIAPVTLFTPVKIDTPKLSRVTFNLIDKITEKGIYKCAISIAGVDNNRIFEVETDENGIVKVDIPPGNYSMSTMLDGYEIISQKFKVPNTNPLTLKYPVSREQVKYSSYFLIGMVCEKIPKTPF